MESFEGLPGVPGPVAALPGTLSEAHPCPAQQDLAMQLLQDRHRMLGDTLCRGGIQSLALFACNNWSVSRPARSQTKRNMSGMPGPMQDTQQRGHARVAAEFEREVEGAARPGVDDGMGLGDAASLVGLIARLAAHVTTRTCAVLGRLVGEEGAHAVASPRE